MHEELLCAATKDVAKRPFKDVNFILMDIIWHLTAAQHYTTASNHHISCIINGYFLFKFIDILYIVSSC